MGGIVHRAEVVVADRSPASWHQGALEAFGQVLVRASGHRDAIERIHPSPRQAAGAINRYDYHVTDDGRLHLRVVFNGFDVEQTLSEGGLTVWESPRLPMLVWTAFLGQVSDGGGAETVSMGQAHLVGPENDPAITDAVHQVAVRRGLRVDWPLMDLTDHVAISVDHVWDGDFMAIQRASQRYGPHAVVVGRLRPSKAGDATRWQAQWYWQPSQTQDETGLRFETQGRSPAEALSVGLERLIDEMAVRAERTAETRILPTTNRLHLSVVGVKSVSDYQKVMACLRSYRGVTDVQALGMQDDTLMLDVAVDVQPAHEARPAWPRLHAAMQHDPHWHWSVRSVQALMGLEQTADGAHRSGVAS